MAKQIILKQLSHGPRTRHQLAQVLAKRDVSPDAAAAALDRIAELGYIDDAAFARAWVESRHRSRGLAPEACCVGSSPNEALIATSSMRRWSRR